MARGVDHVKRVAGAVNNPRHAHSLRLDGDAAFAFDVHAVQVLVAHIALLDDASQLQHPVSQGGFAVVDVGDNAEVSNPILRGMRRKNRLAYCISQTSRQGTTSEHHDVYPLSSH